MSVEKALLFVFLERERAFPRHSPEILTYLFRIARESPGTGNSGLANRILPTNVSLRHPNVGKLSDSRLSFNEFFLIYF